MDEDRLGISEVRGVRAKRVVHVLRPLKHLLHVAFDNRIEASEKRFDGGPVRHQSGRLVARTLFLPAGSEMRGWTTGQVDFLSMEVSPAAVRAASEEAGQRTGLTLRPATPLEDPVLWHLACVLRADISDGCPGGMLLRDSIHSVLARHLAVALPGRTPLLEARPGALPPRRLRAVREFIQSNLHREVRLAEIASVAGMSVFHFTRAFKAVVGLPPYQFVVEQRVQAGCRLLEATELTLDEIASATGFATATGFAAAFRRRWGVSPGAYRRSTQH